jgi:hypothetical protein
MTAFMNGEDFDEESGFHHIDHALTNLMFIKYNLRVNPEMDDRYKAEVKEDI